MIAPSAADLRPLERREPVQRAHAVDRADPRLGRSGIKARPRQRRRHRARLADQLAQFRLLRLRYQHLARPQPRQHRPQLHPGTARHRHIAGRDVDPGERPLAADLGIGAKIIVPPRLQQALLGQRARGDQSDHLAMHDGFVAALLRLGRILHLLADRDAESLADQRQEVPLGGMHRHATHRNVLARDTARAWSARYRAPRSPPPRRRRTSRRNRPSGRTAAHPRAAP